MKKITQLFLVTFVLVNYSLAQKKVVVQDSAQVLLSGDSLLSTLDSLETVATKDSLGKSTVIRDSVLNNQLNLINQQLEAAELKRITDSIHRVELQRELELVRAADYLKRKELQDKIAKINETDSLRKVQQGEKLELLRKNSVGFSVVPFADTLFQVFTKTGPFTPQERAKRINELIIDLYESGTYESQLLRVQQSEGSWDIYYGEASILMSVTDLDGLWNQTTAQELAFSYKAKIDTAITVELERNNLKNTAIRFGEALIVIFLFGVMIVFFNKVFRKLAEKIKVWFTGKSIKFNNYEFLSDERLIDTSIWLTQVIKLLIILIMLYICLPIVFSIFPSTQSWAQTLIGWIVAPIKKVVFGIIDYLPNLFTILVIYFMTRYVVKVFHFLAKEIETGKLNITGFYRDWAMPTFNILKFLAYAYMFTVIFRYLPGSNSAVFQGVSVFIGILFSLGSSSAIGNAVAGLVLTYMRPFKIGDRVQVGGVTGDVIEKSLLVTRIRTVRNEEITIPNGAILSSHTINYSTPAEKTGLILQASVTIGYDIPWKNVHEALIEAGLRSELVLKNPQPFVFQTSLDDFYVAYQLNCYTKEPSKQGKAYSAIHQNIQDVFNERGIEILSPHYRAARDGNQSTIPPNYLPEDYQAPRFGVDVKKSE